MDDLEAVWGPNGRATTDPASVRPVPSQPAPTPSIEPNRSPERFERAVPAATSVQSIGRGRRDGVLAGVAAGSVGLVVVGALLLGGGSGKPPVAAAPARLTTATTIVSAAADLLGRGTTTTLPPAPSTTAWLVTTTAPPTTTTVPPPLPARSVAGAERAAQAFADAMNRRDCEGLVALFSASTRDLLGDTDELCAGLTGQEVPTIAVEGPARATARGASVTLVAGDEREDLFLVEESGRWLVDLLG